MSRRRGNDSEIGHMNVVGTKVATINLEQAVTLIEKWLDDDEVGRYICVTDVNCIMQSYRRDDVRRAFNSADICVPDGVPLTWVGRLRGHSSMGRVYGPDLMLATLSMAAEKGYTNLFYGGAEGVAQDLKDVMTARFSGLHVLGAIGPPFRPLTEGEKLELVDFVNMQRPDLMWIGLGAPKQDLFMFEFQKVLKCKLMIGVGAAFDFHTQRIPQAPRWMMRLGLEWFFRLCTEPRRLGPRYLKNNPAFVWNVFLQLAHLKKFPQD